MSPTILVEKLDTVLYTINIEERCIYATAIFQGVMCAMS